MIFSLPDMIQSAMILISLSVFALKQLPASLNFIRYILPAD